jgi:hypothetical protein
MCARVYQWPPSVTRAQTVRDLLVIADANRGDDDAFD